MSAPESYAPALGEAREPASLGKKARLARLVLFGAGLGVLAGLVAHFDVVTLWAHAEELGWRLVPLVVIPGAILHGAFLAGWWMAFPDRRQRPGPLRLARSYFPGESVNVLTGLAQMGGEPLKAWLLRHEIGWQKGLATVISARTLRTIAQLLFVTAGLGAALLILPMPEPVQVGLTLSTLVVGLGVAAFFLLQQRGLLSKAVRLFDRLGLPVAAQHHAQAREIDRALAASYRGQGQRIWLSVGLQWLGFCGGVVEVYLVCRFLGQPLTVSQAFLAESLAVTLSTVVFFAPAGLGVVEGGRVLVFQLLGLPSVLGLVTGLVRRLRELTWAGGGMAVYGLIGWRSPALPTAAAKNESAP